jgi:hypothetical protein
MTLSNASSTHRAQKFTPRDARDACEFHLADPKDHGMGSACH